MKCVPWLIDRRVRACSREKARDAIFYSYTKNINGFAAKLEPDAPLRRGVIGPEDYLPQGKEEHLERVIMERSARGRRRPMRSAAASSTTSGCSLSRALRRRRRTRPRRQTCVS